MTDDFQSKRKLQQVGSSTLAVTLPVEWAQKQGLEKGDKVVLQRDEIAGSLLLVPEQPNKESYKGIVSTSDCTTEELKQRLIAQYILGRHLISVQTTNNINQSILETVFQLEQRLMGFGVVEQDEKEIVIRCSVAPDEFDLHKLLSRIAHLEKTTRNHVVNIIINGIETISKSSKTRIDRAEQQVWKLFCLFLRLLHTIYRNPQLNQSVGISSGLPLLGYRSVVQDFFLMTEHSHRLTELLQSGQWSGINDTHLSEAVNDFNELISDTLDEMAKSTRINMQKVQQQINAMDETLRSVQQSRDTHSDIFIISYYFKQLISHISQIQLFNMQLLFRNG